MALGRPSHLTTLSCECLFTWRICGHVLRIAQASSSPCAAVSGDRACWAWWPRHRIHKARSHTCKHKGSADVMLLVKAYPDQEYAQHLEEQLQLLGYWIRSVSRFRNRLASPLRKVKPSCIWAFELIISGVRGLPRRRIIERP